MEKYGIIFITLNLHQTRFVFYALVEKNLKKTLNRIITI